MSDSNIIINIVEPGSPVTPNTGLFSQGLDGGTIATISIVSFILVASIISLAYYYHKHHKLPRFTSSIKAFKLKQARKQLTIGLSIIALLTSAFTFAGLKNHSSLGTANAAEGGGTNTSLDLTVSDVVLDVELADEPVFAVAPVTLTVAEATTAGYTLKAYAEDTTLSSTETDQTISMITLSESAATSALSDNTWGLATEEPEAKDNEIFYSLPESAADAIILTDKDYKETAANDTTTVYLGFYITPDLPYGTYTGATVDYSAEENAVATVTFDGNGKFYFDNASQSTNEVGYSVVTTDNTDKYSHTPNITDEGVQEGNVGYKGREVVSEVVTIPGAASIHIALTYGGGYSYNYYMGYASMWQGSHPAYTAQNDYDNTDSIKNCGNGEVTDGRYAGGDTNTTVECDVAGDSVTFAYYANGGGPGSGPTYGYYAVITGYDENGNEVYIKYNEAISGNYMKPNTDGANRFLGWSTEAGAVAAEYSTEYDITNNLALNPGENLTLYAISEPAFTISYNGNGADAATTMTSIEQYTTDLETTAQQVDLLASNFQKEGYGFVGWSTDNEAWDHLTNESTSDDPTIYGPNQTITVDPTASTKLTLYAVWAPAEEDNEGNPITLQDWTGCSAMTATTYDTDTGALTVGKNTITALTDSRDGKVYTVAKLADGNCWMTENLKLDNEPELSTTNTNHPSLPLTNNYAEQTTSNKLSASSNTWCNSWSTTEEQIACYDQSIINTNNVANTTTNPSFSQDFTGNSHNGNLDTNLYSYGNYYNWYSATAGNGTYSTGEQGAETVSGDLCPAGWQLPVGGETDESVTDSFWNLNVKMGSKQYSQEGSQLWRSFPNNFVYSGYWYGSSAGGRGYNGYYWSSTAYNTVSAYNLYFGNGGVDPGTGNGGKNGGYSVRCLAPAE